MLYNVHRRSKFKVLGTSTEPESVRISFPYPVYDFPNFEPSYVVGLSITATTTFAEFRYHSSALFTAACGLTIDECVTNESTLFVLYQELRRGSILRALIVAFHRKLTQLPHKCLQPLWGRRGTSLQNETRPPQTNAPPLEAVDRNAVRFPRLVTGADSIASSATMLKLVKTVDSMAQSVPGRGVKSRIRYLQQRSMLCGFLVTTLSERALNGGSQQTLTQVFPCRNWIYGTLTVFMAGMCTRHGLSKPIFRYTMYVITQWLTLPKRN